MISVARTVTRTHPETSSRPFSSSPWWQSVFAPPPHGQYWRAWLAGKKAHKMTFSWLWAGAARKKGCLLAMACPTHHTSFHGWHRLFFGWFAFRNKDVPVISCVLALLDGLSELRKHDMPTPVSTTQSKQHAFCTHTRASVKHVFFLKGMSVCNYDHNCIFYKHTSYVQWTLFKIPHRNSLVVLSWNKHTKVMV